MFACTFCVHISWKQIWLWVRNTYCKIYEQHRLRVSFHAYMFTYILFKKSNRKEATQVENAQSMHKLACCIVTLLCTYPFLIRWLWMERWTGLHGFYRPSLYIYSENATFECRQLESICTYPSLRIWWGAKAHIYIDKPWIQLEKRACCTTEPWRSTLDIPDLSFHREKVTSASNICLSVYLSFCSWVKYTDRKDLG